MRSKVKGVLLGAVMGLALTGTAFAANNAVNLEVNGKTLPTDVAPVIVQNRTLVPIRVISESLGADVKWDPATQKVTITKNDKVIELTINSKTVLNNGNKLTELDVAPQLVNNRTMVPIRVISEALGAEVKWNGDTRTVSTTFNEVKDEMTAEDLVLKSSEAMAKYDTYKYTGTAELTMSSAALPEKMNVNTDLTGSYKQTGSTQEIYQQQTLQIPSVGNQPATSMKMEAYSNGKDFYTKVDGQDWQKLELGADLSQYLGSQDPEKSLEMMKDYGLILSYGNDTVVNGKDCYTVVVKVDSKKYMDLVKSITSDIVPTTDPEAKKVFDEMMASLKFDMNEKVYIQKDTLLMTKIDVTGNISMVAQGLKMNEDVTCSMDISGYGEPVTMPQIAK